MDNITLGNPSKQDFKRVYDEIFKETGLLFCHEDTIGIYCDDCLIGLVCFRDFDDVDKAIALGLLKEYRGRGISALVVKQLFDIYSIKWPHVRNFIINTLPDNYIAIRSAEKMDGFERTHEYDEGMIDEGIVFYVVFKKQNPYYEPNAELKKIRNL